MLILHPKKDYWLWNKSNDVQFYSIVASDFCNFKLINKFKRVKTKIIRFLTWFANFSPFFLNSILTLDSRCIKSLNSKTLMNHIIKEKYVLTKASNIIYGIKRKYLKGLK